MNNHKTQSLRMYSSTMLLYTALLLSLSLMVTAGPSEAPWGAWGAGGRSVVLVAAPLAGEQQARLRASPAFPARRLVAACSRRVFPWWQLRAGCDCAAALDHSLRRLARWAREARGMPIAVLSALHPRDAAAEPVVLTMSLPQSAWELHYLNNLLKEVSFLSTPFRGRKLLGLPPVAEGEGASAEEALSEDRPTSAAAEGRMGAEEKARDEPQRKGNYSGKCPGCAECGGGGGGGAPALLTTWLSQLRQLVGEPAAPLALATAAQQALRWVEAAARGNGSLLIVRSLVPLSEDSLSALLEYAENATRSAENKSRLVAVLDGCPTAHNGSLDVFIHGRGNESVGDGSSLDALLRSLLSALGPSHIAGSPGEEEEEEEEGAEAPGGRERAHAHVPCANRTCLPPAQRARRHSKQGIFHLQHRQSVENLTKELSFAPRSEKVERRRRANFFEDLLEELRVKRGGSALPEKYFEDFLRFTESDREWHPAAQGVVTLRTTRKKLTLQDLLNEVESMPTRKRPIEKHASKDKVLLKNATNKATTINTRNKVIEGKTNKSEAVFSPTDPTVFKKSIIDNPKQKRAKGGTEEPAARATRLFGEEGSALAGAGAGRRRPQWAAAALALAAQARQHILLL